MSGPVDGRRVVGHHDRHEVRSPSMPHTRNRWPTMFHRRASASIMRAPTGWSMRWTCRRCAVPEVHLVTELLWRTYHSGTGVSDGGLISCLLAALESLNDVRNGLGSMTRAVCQWVRVPAMGGCTHMPATLFGTKPQRPRLWAFTSGLFSVSHIYFNHRPS